MNRSQKLIFNFLIGLLVVNCLVIVTKNIVRRERPTQILTDYSFPSQHSANAFYVAAYLAAWPLLKKKQNRQTRRYLVIGLYLCAVAVGYSRLYLNVHYFSDVVAGGIMGLVLAKYFFKTA